MTILIYLYFISLMTSISLMDLFSTLMLFQLIYLVITKKYRLQPLNLKKYFLPWIIIILISLIANYSRVHWMQALIDLKWMFRAPLVAWCIAASDFKNKCELKYIRYFYIPILVTSIYAVLIPILGFDPLQPHRTDMVFISTVGGLRTPGCLGNPMAFAHSYGILFCVFWVFCLFVFGELKAHLKKIDFYGILLTLFFAATAIFLSFTRGAWLSIGLSIFVVTFMYRPKWILYLLPSGALFLILVYNYVPTVQRRLWELSVMREYQMDRWNLWQANLKMFFDHPLTGVGAGENFYRLDEYYAQMQLPQNSFKSNAHNQFLQQLGGSGIFGLLIYLSFLFSIGWRAFRLWRKTIIVGNLQVKESFVRPLSLGLFAVVLHMLLGGIFEANFEASVTLHMFCFFLGVFLYFEISRNENSTAA